ncbi:dihydrodipicolinate synthase family protein [Lacrimispora sp. NSJ-141]|uniref:Dihydrodipicolinate synthase family protein n=1 Tax=Lientehia hominis TaxID=2897778 RepID=A0AAP2RL31_9FIRM|nr:dihydrodipicolinate synthase family protein [Lientehia hominis]MCD2493668.1 dihydrodipicolinate synthase family protein [Lientehia hominis]
MKKLYGVVVPIVTPFTPEDEVDVEGLKRLTDFLIDKGVHCLYPAGSTGEMLLMNVEERKILAETVVKQAAGRVPVFIQAGAMNLRDTLELAAHAVSVGADGIAIVTPSYFGLSDDELFIYYKTIADSVPADCSVYMYGIPQCSVNDITPELAVRVAEACPNVVGLKYSFNDMIRLQKFMEIRGGDFSVFSGCDNMFAMTALAGADGIVSGNAQAIPEHYVAIWNAVKEGDAKKAMSLQSRTNMLNNIMCRNFDKARFKAVLKHRGVLEYDFMRAPLQPLDTEEAENMNRLLDEKEFTKVLM